MQKWSDCKLLLYSQRRRVTFDKLASVDLQSLLGQKPFHSHRHTHRLEGRLVPISCSISTSREVLHYWWHLSQGPPHLSLDKCHHAAASFIYRHLQERLIQSVSREEAQLAFGRLCFPSVLEGGERGSQPATKTLLTGPKWEFNEKEWREESFCKRDKKKKRRRRRISTSTCLHWPLS